MSLGIEKIEELLGGDAKMLLDHKCQGITSDTLHLPGADFVDRVLVNSIEVYQF